MSTLFVIFANGKQIRRHHEKISRRHTELFIATTNWEWERYLTIKSYDPEMETYTLGFPNSEVRKGFAMSLAFSSKERNITEWKEVKN